MSPVPVFTRLGPNPEFKDLVNKTNTIVSELQNILLNMDSINVTSLSAGTVIVYDLDGGPGTITLNKDGMVINNGTVNTFVVDINGNVTMTSATIQSATGFPRIVMDPSGSLFAAYSSSSDVLTISPFGPVSTPSMRLYNSDSATVPRGSIYINEISGTTYFTFFGQEAVQLTSPDTWVNGPLRVNAYADFSDGTTDLQTRLAAKATAGASTSSHIQGNHNHGIPDGTVLMVDGGGTVTFSASGGFTHSHTQT